jgi:hypothetical protein
MNRPSSRLRGEQPVKADLTPEKLGELMAGMIVQIAESLDAMADVADLAGLLMKRYGLKEKLLTEADFEEGGGADVGKDAPSAGGERPAGSSGDDTPGRVPH